MADDLYTAAEERAQEARRAGLQAKKDEQPQNTARSYAAKQREWRAWCSTPRPGPDGALFTWPDGELVTPDKLAAWLKEDILQRRVKAPKKRRGRGRAEPLALVAGEEQAALREAEALAATLAVPVAEAVQILANDSESYVPPPGITATSCVERIAGRWSLPTSLSSTTLLQRVQHDAAASSRFSKTEK
jgi:hypothetical protein